MITPRVSVIMSVYNGEPYLSEAVDSILNQTHTDFEFIIINDGSEDNTGEILSDYARKDYRVNLLNNETNIGYTRSLNKGIKVARGMYIARQDADDISHPNRLERQVRYLDLNPEVGLLGSVPQYIDSSGILKLSCNQVVFTDHENIHRQLLTGNCFHHGSVMIRKECIDQVGVYNVDLEPSEDYDLWLRLSEVTRMANLEEGLYYYREHSNSVSSKRLFQQKVNKARALERAIYRRYSPQPPEDILLLVSLDYFRAAVVGSGGNFKIEARDCLEKALNLNPSILENPPRLEKIVIKYIPSTNLEASLNFVENVFDVLLPINLKLLRIKSRIQARLYINAVFASLPEKTSAQVYDHLWKGVRKDPNWLLNRGVISLLVKSMFHKGSKS
jgi:glycosyltransferase involved in cell wall biosynthesis